VNGDSVIDTSNEDQTNRGAPVQDKASLRACLHDKISQRALRIDKSVFPSVRFQRSSRVSESYQLKKRLQTPFLLRLTVNISLEVSGNRDNGMWACEAQRLSDDKGRIQILTPQGQGRHRPPCLPKHHLQEEEIAEVLHSLLLATAVPAISYFGFVRLVSDCQGHSQVLRRLPEHGSCTRTP